MSILVVAGTVVGSVAVEFIFSVAYGPLLLHQQLGGLHSVLHFFNFFLAAPAVACLILAGAPRSGVRSVVLRFAAIGACWITCMAALFGNIVVGEAIYGIDGAPPIEIE
jgi:hypothetical protein